MKLKRESFRSIELNVGSTSNSSILPDPLDMLNAAVSTAGRALLRKVFGNCRTGMINVGGDFYLMSIRFTNFGQIGLVHTDVSGKGVH